jgi:hypothetical protein
MLLAPLPIIMLPGHTGLLAEVTSRTVVSAWLFGGLLMLTALVRGAIRTNIADVGSQEMTKR